MANQTINASGTESQTGFGSNKVYLLDTGNVSLAGMVVTDDVIVNVPADSLVLWAGIQLVTPESTATVLTLDVGDGDSSTGWVDGFNAVSGSAGDWSVTTGVALTNGPDNMIAKIDGDASTINVDLQAVTGVVTECVIRVCALVVNLR